MEPTAPDERTLPALYMIRPRTLLAAPPLVTIPDGYALRPYNDGDEQPLLPLFAQEGWELGGSEWQDYKDGILPNGLFLLWHTASGQPIGTAGAVHHPR